MEKIYNNNSKINPQNIINLYDNPSSDNVIIKGIIVKKNGKNIRISSDTGDLYDIITKNDLKCKNGEMLNIKKSEIEMIQKVTDEKIDKEKELEKEELKELERLNLEKSGENLDAVKNLKKYGVNLTEDTIRKFAYLKNLVSDISDRISISEILSIMAEEKNIDSISITEFSEKIRRNDFTSKNLEENTKYYANSSKMSYDEAREVAKKLYKSEMGKDIQDIIIALDKMGIELTRENIDRVHDIFAKVYDIKDMDTDSIVRAVKTEKSLSINLLYNVKNYVVSSGIKSSKSFNSVEFINNNKPLSEEELEDLTEDIKKLLSEMNIEGKDYEEIAKDLIKNNIELNSDKIQEINAIRENIKAIQNVLDKDIASILMKSGIDIENMNIDDLLSLIKKVQEDLLTFDFASLTKEDIEIGQKFLDAVKSLKTNSVIYADKSLSRLLNRTRYGSKFYDEIYGSNEPKYISESDRELLRVSSVLNKINKLDLSKIDYTRNDVSLRYIAERNGLIESENYRENDTRLVKFNYSQNLDVSISENQVKITLTEHYEYMRYNMRYSHVKSMLDDGIDVFNSDIRAISGFMRDEIEKASRVYNTFRNFDTFELNRIAIDSMKMKSDLTIESFTKKAEINANTNNYIDNIKSFERFADERSFGEVREKLSEILKNLSIKENLSRDIIRENTNLLYSNLKEIERIITSSERTDKNEFYKKLRETADNIRATEKEITKEQMVQIPFYMNNGESSNANVYAKSSKSSSKKIDPEDMSVLIDLKTKNLGKMGFFMKVEKKDIRLKISGNSDGVSRLRAKVKTLSAKFESIGYNLTTVDLVTPEDTAKIAFVEDNAPKNSSLLDMRV